MASSCRTASQNHAISAVERRVNSSSDPMPCRSINRVRWLCAISSGVGRHTISPPNSNFSMIAVRIVTDSLPSIRVYPCSSVVDLLRLRLCRVGSVSVEIVASYDDFHRFSSSSPHDAGVGRGPRRGAAPPLPSPLLHPMEERECLVTAQPRCDVSQSCTLSTIRKGPLAIRPHFLLLICREPPCLTSPTLNISKPI